MTTNQLFSGPGGRFGVKGRDPVHSDLSPLQTDPAGRVQDFYD